MINHIPERPVGEDAEAIFMQWVWDQLTIHGKLIDTPEIKFSHTTSGVRPHVKSSHGGGASKDKPVWL